MANGVVSSFFPCSITVAWIIGAGFNPARAADAVAMRPATQPIQLVLPAERVAGLGQPPDAAQTAVTVHLTGGEAISLPVVADTFLWKESKNSSGSGGWVLLRDNRFAQGLVKIDPQGVDSSAEFKASFHLKVGGVERKGQPATLSLHRVLTDWSEDATWFAPRPDQDRAWNGLKAGTDYDEKPLAQWRTQALTDNQVIDIDGLETAVKAWRGGEWPNYGLLILLNGKALQCTFPSREKSMRSVQRERLRQVGP